PTDHDVGRSGALAIRLRHVVIEEFSGGVILLPAGQWIKGEDISVPDVVIVPFLWSRHFAQFALAVEAYAEMLAIADAETKVDRIVSDVKDLVLLLGEWIAPLPENLLRLRISVEDDFASGVKKSVLLRRLDLPAYIVAFYAEEPLWALARNERIGVAFHVINEVFAVRSRLCLGIKLRQAPFYRLVPAFFILRSASRDSRQDQDSSQRHDQTFLESHSDLPRGSRIEDRR